MTGGKILNLVLKKMLELFLKAQKNIRNAEWTLENKQAKSAKLCANIRWRELKGEKCSKTFSKYLMERICKIKQYLDYINWLYKSKYSFSPKDILKSEKKREKLYTKETTSKAGTTEFLSKIPNRKKISNEDFNLCVEET